MVEITKNLFWVGAKDPKLRVFDIIMTAEYGTTYNSYLLKNKTAEDQNAFVLFETVKDKFFDEFWARLQEDVTNIKDIKYLVVNHTEPDHSGSVSKILALIPDITIISSPTAKKYLENITNKTFQHVVAKEGSDLNLGTHTLSFKSVPQLHWPDTIYTYIVEEKTLITCDSFGAHYSSDKCFYNQLEGKEISAFDKAYKYYFDVIMGPFKPFVLKALAKIEDLEIDYVAPGHGLIFDDMNFPKYKHMYKKWASATPKKDIDILIGYVSAYGYTEKIAEKIEAIALAKDKKVEVINLEDTKVEDFMKKVDSSRVLLLGSTTILGDTLPQIWAVLSSLNGTINKGLIAGTFGSYGWSGEATKFITERFNQLKLKQPSPPLTTVFNPSDTEMEKIEEFTKLILESL